MKQRDVPYKNNRIKFCLLALVFIKRDFIIFTYLCDRNIFFFFNRHCNPCGFWPAQLSLSILSRKVFTECRCQRHVKPATWRTSD